MINLRRFCAKEITHFCEDKDFPIAVLDEEDQVSLPMHSHHYTELLIVRSGTAIITTDNQELELSAGSIVVLPPEKEHQLQNTDNFSSLTLLYQESQLPLLFYDIADISGYHSLFPTSHSSSGQEKCIGFARLTQDELSLVIEKGIQLESMLVEQLPGWKITVMTSFYSLLISLCKAVDDRNNQEYYPVKSINEVMRYMEIHFPDRIQIKDLTDIAHMSESSLNRSFKQFFGLSSIQMLNKIRLRKSAKLLKESSMPISMIASSCGFYDSSHFCRRFQASYHMTPDRFRKNQLKTRFQQSDQRGIEESHLQVIA